ncbi:patatin-like phospholipase family protein [Vibrio algivorus]|uniref:Patatin family protein n=1 Tax=Vibrio algivorus TaxID=1667024 RepID=A0A557P6T8_9VIBR|nr:patatin-like phospholipase family protein [Vibrio algivorus]TVO36367.1 patatin family protein [Vibrio algivorus]GLT15802.1 patatin family protein [Vibrio algivorus]
MKNSGVITDAGMSIDLTTLNKYANGRHALVAQGGGQKGIFTAGVLDSFLDAALDPFDVFYGTSAGALNLTSYICRQRGLGKAFITELTTRPEFFRLFKHIRRKQRLDLDWAFDQLIAPPYLLDIDVGRFALGDREAYAAVTNMTDLHDEYLPITTNNWADTLKATCAIPALYRHEVEIDGKYYVDGGVSAAIPAQEAWRKGARLITVIRTEPIDLTEEIRQEQSATVLNSFLNRVGLDQHLESLQTRIAERTASWRLDFDSFLKQRIERSKLIETEQAKPLLNGGRWLFGSSDVYRLCHLLGDQFDAGIMDMMLVHHQTFTLTHNFMLKPPDDCFILQIAPDQPLRSSPLLSKPEDLEFDYQLGLQAGRRYIEQFSTLVSKPAVIHKSAYS